jgi:4-coumarate--CoA ligase
MIGTSKGVILMHKNFIAMSLMMTADQDRHGEPRNLFLCFMSMFHTYGLLVIMYSQLRRGNTVVSMGKFELEKVLGAVDKYKVTHLFIVPPVMLLLANQHSAVKKYDLSSLKQIVYGGAPLGKKVTEDCAKNIPHAEICQVIAVIWLCFALF